MAGDEIGVKMGEDDVGDAQSPGSRFLEVGLDVALGIDDDSLLDLSSPIRYEACERQPR